MATNTFCILVGSDWGPGHLTIIIVMGGEAFSNNNCPLGRVSDHFFKCPVMLVAEINSHITLFSLAFYLMYFLSHAFFIFSFGHTVPLCRFCKLNQIVLSRIITVKLDFIAQNLYLRCSLPLKFSTVTRSGSLSISRMYGFVSARIKLKTNDYIHPCD